jgi:hypothetical protein
MGAGGVATGNTDRSPAQAAARARGVGSRLAAGVLVALLCVAGLELGARLAWNILYGVPLLRPDHVFYVFYPELENVDAARPSRRDGFYDVLLLGASTIAPQWGTVEQEIGRQLTSKGHHRVRIFNLGRAAHSSRDSLVKYTALEQSRFDLVVFYDGLNETRANYAPPDLFREDYGHYAWYEIVNAMAPYHTTARLALPYTLRLLFMRAGQILNRDEYVPRHRPRQDWLHYGDAIRSAQSFGRNLRRILSLAGRRGDPVLLATFAVHVPPNYSLQAFRAKTLDYGRHLLSVEFWGRREVMLRAITAHNEVVRNVAVENPGVRLVDVDHLMPRSGRYFDDVCHLTGAGSAKLVELLLAGHGSAEAQAATSALQP